MPNFKKLKILINQFEKKKEFEQIKFYEQLKKIAEIEIGLKQIKLDKW